MFPGDASFTAYNEQKSKAPKNGRIMLLKIASSFTRHAFYLQSKQQPATAAANHFSKRDLRIIKLVDDVLKGDSVDVDEELEKIRRENRRDDDDDDDDEGDDDEDEDEGDGDVDGARANRRSGGRRMSTTGGAGSDATGGDFREEGEEAREGGADGARA